MNSYILYKCSTVRPLTHWEYRSSVEISGHCIHVVSSTTAVNRGWADTILGSYIHEAAAVESIAMDGQSIRSKVAAAVTHNSDSQ